MSNTHKAEHKVDEVKEEVRHKGEELKNKAAEWTDKAKEKAHDAEHKIREVAHSAGEKLHDFSDKASNTTLNDLHENAGHYISSRPLTTLLGAFAVGAVIGMFYSRR